LAGSLTNASACRTGGAAAKLSKSSGDWSSPGLAAPVDDSAPRSASAYNNARKRFIRFPQLCASKESCAIGSIYLGRFSKTQSGVRIQELAIGNGLEATRGDSVEFDYVLRSARLPFTLTQQPLSLMPLLVYCPYACSCARHYAPAKMQAQTRKYFGGLPCIQPTWWPRLSACRVQVTCVAVPLAGETMGTS